MAGNNNGRLTNAIGESLSPAAINLTVPKCALFALALPFSAFRYLPVVPADQPANIGERPAHVLQAEQDAVEMGGVGIMAVHDTWPVSASLSISARHLS